MPGLTVRDISTGRVKIDTSTNIGTALGILQIGGEGFQQQGSIQNAILQQGMPFYFVINGPINFFRENVYPSIWFENDRLHYHYPSPGAQAYQRPSMRILYGIS